MPTTNGLKAIAQITELAKTRPIVAIVLALIILATFNGGISYVFGSLGQGSKISSEIAELQRKDIYLDSAIRSVDRARIEEHVRLQDDGKLLSEASIRLIIIEEFAKLEDRLVARLK